MKDYILNMMDERGLDRAIMAEMVLQLQKPYLPALTLEDCVESIDCVLSKREVQYAILTGLSLDILAEKKVLPKPLNEAIEIDESLFGIDEVLGMAIGNIYGSIGVTNFGYLDKVKTGLVGTLDYAEDQINTFADDLVSAIVAAAAARIVHSRRDDVLQKHQCVAHKENPTKEL